MTNVGNIAYGVAVSYKFCGKELDRMDGLDWYDSEARFLDVTAGARFTSPDPRAWDYPEVSPYAYGHDSFVNRIDPDGRDDYRLMNNGLVKVIRKTDEKTDKLYATNSNTFISISRGILSQLLHKKDMFNGHFAVMSNAVDAYKLFKFAADYSNVEWGLSGFHSQNGNDDKYYVVTSNKPKSVTPIIKEDGIYLFINYHSHNKLVGKDQASGPYKQIENGAKYISYVSGDGGDLATVYDAYEDAEKKGYELPKFFLYNARTHNKLMYNGENKRIFKGKVKSYKDLMKW